jgi:enoyl-CoA hydratase
VAAVEFEKRGHVAWITINRPEKANTLIAESFSVLIDSWEAIRDDDEIRVGVLMAVGDKDFCCGGDLMEYIPSRTGDRTAISERQRPQSRGASARRALLVDNPLYKPIIAAINGRTLGAGMELLEVTDIRIASETATFGLPEAKVGLVPGAGSLVRLPRQIPYAHAMYMMLTGQTIDAATAMNWGLISEVVKPELLLERAEELAQLIATNAPLSMRAIKRTAYETFTLPWSEAHTIESSNARTVLSSDDAREGPRAFAENRDPNFLGR